jgi:hypothetical protein
MIDTDELVRSIAAHGLPGATSLPRDPLSAADWTRLVQASASHRTLGYAVLAVEEGALVADEAQRGQLLDAQAAAMRQALVLERELLAAVRILEADGIPTRVLKGAAVAHLDHAAPTLRAFQDIDLLVAPTDIDRAIAALAAHGHQRDLPPRTTGWDRRFAKDIALRTPGRAEIDLHRTLVPGAFGFRIDLDELWDGARRFELAGRTLHALGAERRAMHAAYALTAGEARPRLSAARDLAQIAAGDGFDLDLLIGLAERWRADLLLADAVQGVAAHLGARALPSALAEWAATAPRDRWQRAARRTYRFAGASNTTTLLGGVLGLRGARAKVGYLHGLFVPGRPYRAARRSTHRPPEWRTGARELLRRRTTPS